MKRGQVSRQASQVSSSGSHLNLAAKKIGISSYIQRLLIHIPSSDETERPYVEDPMAVRAGILASLLSMQRKPIKLTGSWRMHVFLDANKPDNQRVLLRVLYTV